MPIAPRPCPFCGSKRVQINSRRENWHVPHCLDCGATGPSGNTRERAVEVWNWRRRPKP